jgi:hypothetical protein
MTPALLQYLEKKKMTKQCVKRNDHQNQFCQMPGSLIQEITTIGVSIERVVATIDVPRSHQGRFCPETKYDSMLLDACFLR